MKQILFLILFLFGAIHSDAQNRQISLNEGSLEQAESKTRGVVLSEFNKIAHRSRSFTISKELQSVKNIAAKDALMLDLFSDKKYKANVSKVETDVNGTVSITGKLADYPMGYFIITTSSDNSSLVYVEIPELNEKYITRTNAATRSNYLIEVDKAKFEELKDGEASIPTAELQKSTQSNIPQSSTRAGVNDVAQIDVMFVYTPAAKAWSAANEGGINNTIANALAKSKIALDNSLVGINLNLVHSAEVSYTESGNSNTDLDRLTYPNDGYLENVHQLRDQYGADLVVFLTKVDDTGGLGWLMNGASGSPTYGFCLVRVQQAGSGYSVIHEIGHNMGLDHHRDQLSWGGKHGVFTYSYGWRWQGSDGNMYCSVMTYDGYKQFADGLYTYGTPYFSNPSINHLGKPTGVANSADAARSLRETKHIVAAYRTSKQTTCTAPFNLTTTNITTNTATLNWSAVSGAQSYVVEYKTSTATNWSVLSTAATSVALGNLIAGTTYNWRVKTNCSSTSSSVYSQSSFTTTGGSSTCASPNNLTASNITTNSVTLNWSAVSGAQSYNIEYKASSSSSWITAVSYSTSTSVVLAGLTAGTTYNWRVKTNCSSTTSSAYSESSFTTIGGGSACAAPTNLTVSDITGNSVVISWSPVSGAQSYRVEFKKPSETSWWVLNEALTATTRPIIGVEKATTYQWRVKTNCSSTSSSDYVYSTFTTSAISCVDNFEPNNSYQSAYPINLGQIYEAGIAYSGDVDYYKFTLTQGSYVNISLERVAADYNMYLLDSRGYTLSWSCNSGRYVNEYISSCYLYPGTYYIYIYGYNGGYDAARCYTLKATASPWWCSDEVDNGNTPLSITDQQNGKVQIYPNPVKDILNIKSEGTINKVTLTDISGKAVLTDNNAENEKAISVGHLPKGMYILTAETENGIVTEKVSIK